MAGMVTGEQINTVLHTVKAMTADGDCQLTILALSLIAACRSCGVARETMMDEIEKAFDEPMKLVPSAQ